MKSVGPTISMKARKTALRMMFRFDSRLMPPSRPATTDSVAIAVMTAMTMICTTGDCSMPKTVPRPGIDLHRTEAERGHDAEHRAEDGEDVDDVAPEAEDPVAEKRIERRPDGQRQALAEMEIGQRQRHDRVDRPGVEAPVQERDGHRLPGGRLGFRRLPSGGAK